MQVPIGKFLTETLYDETVESQEQREALYGQGDHLRVYAEADYIKLLDLAGFKVKKFIWKTNNSFSTKGEKYGLVEGEKIYIAEKQ